MSVQKFPIRSLRSSLQHLEEEEPVVVHGYGKKEDDGVVQVKKILRMLEESNERPAAYYLYN